MVIRTRWKCGPRCTPTQAGCLRALPRPRSNAMCAATTASLLSSRFLRRTTRAPLQRQYQAPLLPDLLHLPLPLDLRQLLRPQRPLLLGRELHLEGPCPLGTLLLARCPPGTLPLAQCLLGTLRLDQCLPMACPPLLVLQEQLPWHLVAADPPQLKHLELMPQRVWVGLRPKHRLPATALIAWVLTFPVMVPCLPLDRRLRRIPCHPPLNTPVTLLLYRCLWFLTSLRPASSRSALSCYKR